MEQLLEINGIRFDTVGVFFLQNGSCFCLSEWVLSLCWELEIKNLHIVVKFCRIRTKGDEERMVTEWAHEMGLI
jgi:hypothetical protein